MAVKVLTNASIEVNGVVLSDRANSVTLTYEIEAVEATVFGGNRAFVGGLQNIAVEIEFMQDFAATETEATIFPLVGTTTTLVISHEVGVPTATNPRYTISGTYLASHTPVAAAVGELMMTSLSFAGGTLVKTTA